MGVSCLLSNAGFWRHKRRGLLRLSPASSKRSTPLRQFPPRQLSQLNPVTSWMYSGSSTHVACSVAVQSAWSTVSARSCPSAKEMAEGSIHIATASRACLLLGSTLHGVDIARAGRGLPSGHEGRRGVGGEALRGSMGFSVCHCTSKERTARQGPGSRISPAPPGNSHAGAPRAVRRTMALHPPDPPPPQDASTFPARALGTVTRIWPRAGCRRV